MNKSRLFLCMIGLLLTAVNLIGAQEQFDQQQPDQFYAQFTQMLFVLGLIILLLVLVSWGLKRFLNARVEQINAFSIIQVLERRPISAKSTIYVVEVEDKRIVLAESHMGITLLSETKGDKTLFEKTLDKA
jgi:flagellar biogenesis protein FliO